MKIYVASSWRNEYQPAVVERLKALRHEVYDFRNPAPENHGFQWSSIDPEWENWTPKKYAECLKHPIAEDGFKFDFNAMQWADVCLIILPCGRSAHTEAGWMKGAGKKVFIYIPKPQEPELMYKLFDGIITDLNEFHTIFNQ
jgi:nucleoside 2-deoxyribosyltransferase